jgi:hypothetical protein
MTKKEVTINAEQKLFVIPSGSGYSTWGFENCYNETFQLAQKLNMPLPLQSQIGTIEQYNQHRAMIDHVAKNGIDLGTWFNLKTDPVVKHVIEEYLRSQRPVRIFYGDTDTGKVWLEEHDVYGRIGRSTGFLKIPLMIVGNSSGGCGLLDACIVRIVDGESKREVYRHPKYQEPKFEIHRELVSQGYVAAVYVDGALHAQFKKPGQAENWIAYMKGERMKP